MDMHNPHRQQNQRQSRLQQLQQQHYHYHLGERTKRDIQAMDFSGPSRNSMDLGDRQFAEELDKLTRRLSINPLGSSSLGSEDTNRLTPTSASSATTQNSMSSLFTISGENERLKNWLEENKLGEYYETFVREDITLDLFPYLRKEDIRKLVHRVGDQIRFWKKVNEPLPSAPSSAITLDDFVVTSSTDNNSTSSIVSDNAEEPTTVHFFNTDNKAMHLQITHTGPIKALVFQTAKLPNNGSYKLNDGFDYYDDDDSLREAIFKKHIHEFWIQHIKANDLPDSKAAGRDKSKAGGITLNSTERPTSREVASHISEFFPGSKEELLAEGLRNSMLLNRRFSTVSGGWRSSVSLSSRLSSATISSSEARRRRSLLTSPSSNASTDTLAPSSTHQAVTSSVGTETEAETETESGTEAETDPTDGSDSDSIGIDQKFLEKLDSEEMSPTEWLRGKLIGNGSFGSVYLAFNVFTGDILAVKQVQLLHNDQRHKKMVEALHQEIRTLRTLEHKHIVQYRGFKNEDGYLNIFLEYIPGGSLATKLDKYGSLEEDTVRKYISQCLSGLAYLHGRGIIHRDIKGANILVDTNDEVKISDFGMSKHEDTAKQRFSMQGTAFWMAPEVARAREQTTTKADIWSLGCLIIELITGQHPFPKLQAFQAIYKIGKGAIPDIPEDASPELQDLLKQCLNVDPKGRPGARELQSHPFFTKK